MTSRWDPFREIEWHPPLAADARWFTPAVDIFEDSAAVLVRVELPGVRPDDITVDADERVLSIRGERRLENADHRSGYHRIERPYGVFARTFALPDSVDGRGAVAIMADGVLTVRLPKRAADESDPPSSMSRAS